MIGFEREAEGKLDRHKRMCLDLLFWLIYEKNGTMQIYEEVMAGMLVCPAKGTCKRYLRGKELKKQFLWEKPKQMHLNFKNG